MTKEDNKNFKNFTKCWICHNDYVDNEMHFHLIMQELRKFNLEISVILNGQKNILSFTISNKVRFIGSFQFLSSSLDSLVKKLNKDNFKYLSQEFDNTFLDLVKQKRILFLWVYE